MNKNKKRSILTNKLVGNREVIMTDEAIEFVKKQGYIVLKPTHYQLGKLMIFLLISIVAVSFIAFMIRADTGNYSDCSKYGICKPIIPITNIINNNINSSNITLGNDGEVIFNRNGTLSGDGLFTFDWSNNRILSVPKIVIENDTPTIWFHDEDSDTYPFVINASETEQVRIQSSKEGTTPDYFDLNATDSITNFLFNPVLNIDSLIDKRIGFFAVLTANFTDRKLYDKGGGLSIDFNNNLLLSANGQQSIDYENRLLKNDNSANMVNWFGNEIIFYHNIVANNICYIDGTNCTIKNSSYITFNQLFNYNYYNSSNLPTTGNNSYLLKSNTSVVFNNQNNNMHQYNLTNISYLTSSNPLINSTDFIIKNGSDSVISGYYNISTLGNIPVLGVSSKNTADTCYWYRVDSGKWESSCNINAFCAGIIDGITDTSSYWLCNGKEGDACISYCQVQLKDGAIIGCI